MSSQFGRQLKQAKLRVCKYLKAHSVILPCRALISPCLVLLSIRLFLARCVGFVGLRFAGVMVMLLIKVWRRFSASSLFCS